MGAAPLKAGHSNTIFTVRDIVDDTGTVIQSYEFNEHGIPMPGSGASSGTFSPKTYQGALSVNDDRNDSGLYLMGHRHFDSMLGRFISRDPIGFRGGLNLFNGAGTSPVTFVDPSGLKIILDDDFANMFPGLREAFAKAIPIAIQRAKEHGSCPTADSWPGNFPDVDGRVTKIDYLAALEGDWDVTFKLNPDPTSSSPWTAPAANVVYGTELGVPSSFSDKQISKLANQILHELTHSGIQRNYDRLSPAEKSKCRRLIDENGDLSDPAYDPRLVGPQGPAIGDHRLSHPARYFQNGIYQHLDSAGGYGHGY